MSGKRALVALFWWLSCVSALGAEPQCQLHRLVNSVSGRSYDSGWVVASGAAAACAGYANELGAIPFGGFTYTIQSTSVSYSGGRPSTCNWTRQRNDGQVSGGSWGFNLSTGNCPPPTNDCASYDGPSKFGFIMVGSGSQPESMCHGPSGCMAFRGSQTCVGGECVAGYGIGSAELRIACPTASGETDEDLNPGEGEACAGSGGALEFCKNATQPAGCGYVNDEYVCVGGLADDQCQRTPGGAMVCVTSAPMPPAPDSGTPGQAATPDGELQVSDPAGTVNTYNYFNSTTVSGSSRGAGRGSNADGSGVTGGGGAEGGGDSGGVELPELEEGEGVATTTAGFFESASEAPIVAALSNLGASIPSGSCPRYTVEIFDHSYSIDPMCDYWEDFASVLSAVMLVGWGLLAVRIVFTA